MVNLKQNRIMAMIERKKLNHKWIVDVLDDIAAFAKENRLSKTEYAAKDAARTIERELKSKEEPSLLEKNRLTSL